MATLPKNGEGTLEEELPHEQLVIFVRHAESRWNRAQAAMSPIGMMWENDHGLSEEGKLQAETLRSKLQEAKAPLEKSDPMDAKEAQWLSRLLSPDVVYSSPFTRALQTACIGLQDILPKSHLVVLREARECKRLGGADSTGVACGEEICQRVREEMSALYEADSAASAAQILKELEQISMDTSSVVDEWWGNVFGETFEEIDENLEALMHRLRRSRGSLAGGGAIAVLVGHSYIIRTIFDAYLMKGSSAPSQYRSLRSKLIPCCGVVGARITWDDHGHPVIKEAVPLLNTTLERPEENDLGGQRASSCTCGRNRMEMPSCVMS